MRFLFFHILLPYRFKHAIGQNSYFVLLYQTQFFELLRVLHPGGQQIQTGRIHGAMPQQIGQLHNVMRQAIEHAGKQMPQVMRKHFRFRYVRVPAQAFHFSPYLFP